MRRTIVFRVFAGLLLFAGSWLAYTQNQNRQPSNKLNKIADDLYEIEGDGGNVAVYITNEGVILVDDKFEYDYNDIVDKVKSVTSEPIRYVLNTHHHGDHTGSNAKLPPNTEIIAHANARKNMIEGKQPDRRAWCSLKKPPCFWAVKKCGRATSAAGTPTATS